MTEAIYQIRLSGTGGQGLVLGARILSDALVRSGRRVAHSQSYEPTSRGGVSRSDIVMSDAPVDFPLVDALDVLVVLDQSAVAVSTGMILQDAAVLTDADLVPEPPAGEFTCTQLPFTSTAKQVGSVRVANVVSLGALAATTGLCSLKALQEAVRALTPPKFLELNLRALEDGFALASPPAGTSGG